ncbi:MAG: DUF6517 family protein [Halolamina sp.]
MIGKFVKLAAVVMLLSSAVSGGWVVAGGPLEGHASAPATVDNATAEDLGFVEPQVQQIAIQDTIAVAGVEKRLNITAYVMATGTEDGEARVLAMTLPGWTIAGVATNPLAYVPLKQAVKHVLPRLPFEVPEVAYEGKSSVELGDKEVTAGEYTVESQAMRIVVARATVDEDVVFAVGVYPEENSSARDRIEALFGNVTHG